MSKWLVKHPEFSRPAEYVGVYYLRNIEMCKFRFSNWTPTSHYLQKDYTTYVRPLIECKIFRSRSKLEKKIISVFRRLFHR